MNVGVIGCGKISGAYFNGLALFDHLKVTACADILPDVAQQKAREHNIPRACSVEELLADPDIQIAVNLTIPAAHADVSLASLAAGKSVYNEKPLTAARTEAQQVLELATRKGLRVGCAPDTFFGAGNQTCRQLIDEGVIGKPLAATAFMLCHGHETWHPSPEFYYKTGGGPMFDMGPYYLTALVNLMGPVRRVAGTAGKGFDTRTITSQPLNGTVITVDVPTHVSGLLEFQSGATATIVTSFDVWAHQHPCIEIYGTEGTLSVPDPNTFGGPVRVKTPKTDWEEVPLDRPYQQNSRGIGVADMALGILNDRPHRATGDLAYHVLDLMHAFHDSAAEGRFIDLQTTPDRPAPLPQGLRQGQLDP